MRRHIISFIMFCAACFFCLSAVAMAQSTGPNPPPSGSKQTLSTPVQEDEEVAQHSKDSEFGKTDIQQSAKPAKTWHDRKASKPHKDETQKSTDTIQHQ
jgi:hypothetical protein